METVEIQTQARNGHVSFGLPAGHEALANARLRIVLQPEPEMSVSEKEAERLTRLARLIAAFDELKNVSAFRAIADPVQWQRELRANDEKHYDR